MEQFKPVFVSRKNSIEDNGSHHAQTSDKVKTRDVVKTEDVQGEQHLRDGVKKRSFFKCDPFKPEPK